MRYRSRKSQLARTRWGGPCAWLGPLTLLLVVTFVPAAARAEDDDDKSIWNLDKRIFDEVIYSFGLTKKPKLDDQIGYQERPRLMVPSDHELPAPKAVDPKTVRQQKPKTDWRDHDSDAFTDPLRPSQSDGGPAVGRRRAAAGSRSPPGGRRGRRALRGLSLLADRDPDGSRPRGDVRRARPEPRRVPARAGSGDPARMDHGLVRHRRDDPDRDRDVLPRTGLVLRLALDPDRRLLKGEDS